MSNKWLEELKEGDNVFLLNNTHGFKIRYKIVRTTKTMIMLDNGRRFKRKNGDAVGETNWHSSYLAEWTQEMQDKADEERKIHRIARSLSEVGMERWKKLSKEKLIAIEEMLK